MRNLICLVIVPLLAIIGIATALTLTGHSAVGDLVGGPGSLLWLLLVLAWVVFRDSRSRWPDQHWFQRLASVLTHRR